MFWLSAELPPEIPAVCIVEAVKAYKVPAELMVAVLRTENGKVGKAYPRSHGTYFGPYQISDKWIPHLKKWGIDAYALQHDGCANAVAGGYILAYYYAREKNWARAVARYNTGSINTEEQIAAGTRYVNKVFNHWNALHLKWTANAK